MKRGFTLMELLIVILVITILAGLALSALAGATELAREHRTKAIIARIDLLIQEKYDGYNTRQLPLRLSGSIPSDIQRQIILNGRRDLMRMELPDRKTDVTTGAADIDPRASVLRLQQPAAHRQFQRKALATWSETSQGAECLYLILSTMRDGDKSALDFLSSGETGDYDGDGMREIWDGWGRPIEFLRWAPGFTTENQALTLQTSDHTVAPDPFDPLKSDPRWADATSPHKPYYLSPLIFSGGSDESLDIRTDNNPFPPFFDYAASGAPDPYALLNDGVLIGFPSDTDADGSLSYGDNITNHYQEP